ncbi:hypothetical protein N665_0587s0016 [Sinapis alba]|nr:hypothetical protein N665_0587s0016 [Sinapis alba]
MTWTCLLSRFRTHTLSSFTRRWRSTLAGDERNEIAFVDLETTVPTKRGITHDGVLSAPTFPEIAPHFYDILNKPKAIIDTLPFLTYKFGKRASDMKMSSLARYFGLGDQTHRSLDDARMNFEVLKSCATVSLLQETSFPGILTATSGLSPTDTFCCESYPTDITNLISKTDIGTDEAKTGTQQDESTPSHDPDAKEEALLK